MLQLPDGLTVVLKRDCPTCVLVEPVLAELVAANIPITVYSQDDPTFPASVANVVDDTALEVSYQLEVEIVPTLIRAENGVEQERAIGWNREQWQTLTGVNDLGAGLPEMQPGCGSKSVEPGVAEALARRFGGRVLQARPVEIGTLEDEIEACFERGWTDGLPVVPPTEARVMRMLAGTTRQPDEIVGIIPPDKVACTVEKVAINAVMAGCKPDYLPVVLAAVEAACLDEYCMHGILATTYFSGPVVVVNGPITTEIGMNSGINALGQGNRANATIGRALQLIIRNVGGGRPGGVDRATLGNTGKYTFCFAENEADSPWESLAVERGFTPETSTVTLLTGDGVQPVVDQKSRNPQSLARTFATCMRTISHPKLAGSSNALLVVSPEHGRVFREAGWSKAHLKAEIQALLQLPGKDLVAGVGGMAEGLPESVADKTVPKFHEQGLNIVFAGGKAGMFSAIISGWVAGACVLAGDGGD